MDKARDLLEESLRAHATQQRALFGLAWVADEQKDWHTAVQHLKAAKQIDVWEQNPEPRLSLWLRYNYGCALVKLGRENCEQRDGEYLTEAVSELQIATSKSLGVKRRFEEELRTELSYLHDTCPAAVEQIRTAQPSQV